MLWNLQLNVQAIDHRGGKTLDKDQAPGGPSGSPVTRGRSLVAAKAKAKAKGVESKEGNLRWQRQSSLAVNGNDNRGMVTENC